MAFHNIRLPDDVERGAQGGPGFKTTILTLSSGFEKRNIDWSRTRGRWDISYGIDKKENLDAVLDFFYARQGRAHGFRFKDWTDFEIGDVATSTPAIFATGDGVTVKFQVFAPHFSGSQVFNRAITRLVASTTEIYVNAVLQTEGVDYTLDDDTGLLDFTVGSPPPDTEPIGIITEFDNPVRFDTDLLAIRAQLSDTYSLPQIELIEIREVLPDLT